MNLHRLQVPADKFNSLPKKERFFVLRFSHLHNDLRHVRQLAHVANNGIQKLADPERQIATYQFLFAVRIWCGILREAEHLYRSAWKDSGLASRLESSLSPETLKAAKEFEDYFRRKNLVKVIRNHFGFHYDAKAITNELTTKESKKIDLAKNGGYQFMTSDRSANVFYTSAESYRTMAMFRAVDPKITGFRKLYDEISSVDANFMKFSQDVLVEIVRRIGLQSTAFTSKSIIDQWEVQPIIFVDEDAIVKRLGSDE